MKWFLKNSQTIIIHSHETIDFLKTSYPQTDLAKVKYVPHPHYIDAYPDTIKYSHCTKKPGEIFLLLLGRIDPSKNPDLIIRVANLLKDYPRLHFLMCGKGERSYCDKLCSMIDGGNVTTDFRYIENGEIPSLLRMCDAMVLPYNTKSELNSGAAYLAFSFGLPVIGSWTGTTRDVDNDLVYCYDDTNDMDEHLLRFKEAIMRFYRDFTENPDALTAKRNRLREMMLHSHSLERTAEALRKAYGV